MLCRRRDLPITSAGTFQFRRYHREYFIFLKWITIKKNWSLNNEKSFKSLTKVTQVTFSPTNKKTLTGLFLCRRRDLNPHPLRDTILSRARLPFRHSGNVPIMLFITQFSILFDSRTTVGHELLSFLLRFACKNLSTRDPASRLL